MIPASGGVSGGELIALTERLLGWHEGAAITGQLAVELTDAAAAIRALLAERDGLKTELDFARGAEKVARSELNAKAGHYELSEQALFASNAALAKALGLLREFPASGYQGAPGVRALIKAFLAKHGHQNWDGAWS